jgi:hypothetical protein
LEGQQIFKQQEGFSNKGLSEEKVGLNLDWSREDFKWAFQNSQQ